MKDMKELAEYREQLQWVVDAGFMEPSEAEEAADSIGCVVRLCQRGHISVGVAGMLIDQMGKRHAEKFVARTHFDTAH